MQVNKKKKNTTAAPPISKCCLAAALRASSGKPASPKTVRISGVFGLLRCRATRVLAKKWEKRSFSRLGTNLKLVALRKGLRFNEKSSEVNAANWIYRVRTWLNTHKLQQRSLWLQSLNQSSRQSSLLPREAFFMLNDRTGLLLMRGPVDQIESLDRTESCESHAKAGGTASRNFHCCQNRVTA